MSDTIQMDAKQHFRVFQNEKATYEDICRKGQKGKLVYFSPGEPALKPYFDNVNVKTIGWGHAIKKGENTKITFSNNETVDLDEVTEIEEWQAEEILAKDIQIWEDDLNEKLEIHGIADKINQRFYDALFDLLYQSGKNHYGEDGDLTSFLDEEDFDLSDQKYVAMQFGEYNGNKDTDDEDVKIAIRLRRADELDIIYRGDYTRSYYNHMRYGDIWGKLKDYKEQRKQVGAGNETEND